MSHPQGNVAPPHQTPTPPRVARPQVQIVENTPPQTVRLSDTLAEAALVAAPPLGAATIMGIVGSAALNDAPGVWITLCTGAVVGVTTLAALVDRRDDHTTDSAAIVWPMLLIWPLAHTWLLATRERIGKKSRLLSGIAGSVAMVAAVAFAQHTLEQARAAISIPPATASGTARQQALDASIDALIEQEARRR